MGPERPGASCGLQSGASATPPTNICARPTSWAAVNKVGDGGTEVVAIVVSSTTHSTRSTQVLCSILCFCQQLL